MWTHVCAVKCDIVTADWNSNILYAYSNAAMQKSLFKQHKLYSKINQNLD